VHPARTVAAAADRLHRLDWRSPARRRVGHERERLAARHRHLDALSPARVLDRGYAVVRTGDGSVLRRAGDVAPGEALDVQLAAGGLAARVEGVHP
ncbi:MAG: exodeoxyribonuclease VII large subunit, partial [Actinomycetota bacterium]|nr:exodeoxyribonuclease VII large subunit [Actinomycetota bacterium]